MAKPTTRQPAPADAPLNGPDVPLEDKQRQLEGRRPADRQEAFIEAQDIDGLGEITTTDIYQGELAAGVDDDLPGDTESLELLTELELRDGETDDPFEAAEEGQTYIPPMDPPTVPDRDGEFDDARIASGFGVSALDEPYDADHHSSFLPADDEVSARVREALLADSATTVYADQIVVSARGGVVTLRGMVDDLDDNDNLIAVAQYVDGVVEVIDKLKIRSL